MRGGRSLPVLRQAGLDQTEPLQRLRRTFNTEAKAREIPYDQVLRWMGHEARADDVNGSHYTGEFQLDQQREWIARLEHKPHVLRRAPAEWGASGKPVGAPKTPTAAAAGR